ncbi:anthrone oxygenase family protein [Aeromicrobium sp.]|uniref:anthrone oxygenase family protein n=1 Tax=Aeromicrobium sp. TaxID=1871063 RepID=UPI002FCA9EF3
MTTSTVLLVAATSLTGLSAGLFATFSYAVMPGLRRSEDDALVSAMRGINIAIINPVFALVFVGSFIASVAALIAGWDDPARPWIIAGLAAYVVGGFVVTGAVNVPLNDALESGTGSSASLRESFEARWVRWNHVRSVLTVAAFVCLVVAAVKS